MTQAERANVDATRSKIAVRQPRQRALRRRLGADAEHAHGVGGHGRPLPARPRCRTACTSRSSTASTPCTATATCTAPRCSRTTSASAPRATRRWCATSSTSPREETRTTGPQWAFAPCICVARDDRWGRIYESFGEDPQLVEQMETAIDGFQGRPRPARRPRPRAGHRQALRRRRPDHLRHRLEQPDDGQLPDRSGRRPGRPRDVRQARAVALRAGDAPARRGQRDAVLLGRRLHRGRARQPDQHARQPAT